MTKLYDIDGMFFRNVPFSPDSYDFNLADAHFEGKVCAFTGHRPGKLPFYGESDISCLRLMGELHRQVEIAVRGGYRNFISGMAVGVDQWAAVSVLDLKRFYPDISLYAALPSPSQPDRWFEWQKERYFDLLSSCKRVYAAGRQYSPACPNIRNAFMVKHADLLIAVYDGKTPGGTQNTLKMAEKKGINVVVLSPKEFRNSDG